MTTEPRNYSRRYKSEYNIFRSIFYMLFVWTVVNPITHFMYKLKVKGKNNIPKKGNYIFAPNHVSEMDPPFVASAVNKHIAFMAKKELFESNDKRHHLIHLLGAFSVDREKPEISTFKTVRDISQTDWPLGIFPEGGTRKNKKIEDIRKGFVVIAKHAKADIIPISIVGFDGYAKKLFEKNITVVIGEPISYKLDTDEIIQKWCAEICKNTGFENCMLNKNEQVEV
ncbi:1-acyl-sn-glycerol-3-phosphate acyltransferase [bacterium]|nr:1-acyl-sn-glycerol-3-phosphate acyltransferase [bacterium]